MEILDLDHLTSPPTSSELRGGRHMHKVNTFAFTSAQDGYAISIAEAYSLGGNSLASTSTDTSASRREKRNGVISKSSASASAFALILDDCGVHSSGFRSDSRFSCRQYRVDAR